MDPDNRTEQPALSGDPPNPIDPPTGCRFHTRCPQAQAVCVQTSPVLKNITAGHAVACLMFQANSGHPLAALEPLAA